MCCCIRRWVGCWQFYGVALAPVVVGGAIAAFAAYGCWDPDACDCRWLVNPVVDVWLVHRRVQMVYFRCRLGFVGAGWFASWSVLWEFPRLLLLAQSDEVDPIMRLKRVPGRQSLKSIQPDALLQRLQHSQEPLLVSMTPAFRQITDIAPLMQRLESCDPRQLKVLSLIRLFEREQERCPPALMPDDALAYDDLPWAATFSVQAQLKRLADVLLSVSLLLVTAPFVALSALLIWLEDHETIFYSQQRSGWLDLAGEITHNECATKRCTSDLDDS